MNRTTLIILIFGLILVAGLAAFLYGRRQAYKDTTDENQPGPNIVEPEEEPDYDVLGYSATSAGTEIFTLAIADQKRRIIFTDKDIDEKIRSLRRATDDGVNILAYFSPKGETAAKLLQFVLTDGSGQVKKLLDNFGASEVPVPSPDGKRLAYVVFSNAEPAGYLLTIMNTDGSSKRILARNETLLSQPAFSPDGKKIAFVVATATGTAIQSVAADGSAPATTLAEFNNEIVYDLAWGKELVFGKRPQKDDGANEGEIYSLGDSGARTRLTNNDKFDGSPVLSPDGKYLALVRTTYAAGKITSGGELTLVALKLSDNEETELGSADGVLGWKSR